jgi:hypothetical protein
MTEDDRMLPPAAIRDELRAALGHNTGNLGRVFALMEQGVISNSDLVANGGGAGPGAVANSRATIRAILDGVIPNGPSVATMAGRSVGGLLRDNPELSEAAESHLLHLRERLDSRTTNEHAVQAETAELGQASNKLAESLEQTSGVYVYTFPVYYRTPVKADPDRFWMKVGKTDRFIRTRVLEQARGTSMPEDPVILRAYHSDTQSPAQIEQTLHRLLESAGHARADGVVTGREWFATNLDYLDSIAREFGYQVITAELPEQ